MRHLYLPNEWDPPQWHPDYGDPLQEFLPLQEFATKLIQKESVAILTLKTPEPGLMYIDGILDNIPFEVYSIPSINKRGNRRFGVFIHPSQNNEEEAYFESTEDAVGYIISLKSRKNGFH